MSKGLYEMTMRMWIKYYNQAFDKRENEVNWSKRSFQSRLCMNTIKWSRWAFIISIVWWQEFREFCEIKMSSRRLRWLEFECHKKGIKEHKVWIWLMHQFKVISIQRNDLIAKLFSWCLTKCTIRNKWEVDYWSIRP